MLFKNTFFALVLPPTISYPVLRNLRVFGSVLLPNPRRCFARFRATLGFKHRSGPLPDPAGRRLVRSVGALESVSWKMKCDGFLGMAPAGGRGVRGRMQGREPRGHRTKEKGDGQLDAKEAFLGQTLSESGGFNS